MKRQDLIDLIDLAEGDKFYYVRMHINADGSMDMRKVVDNFNQLELSAFLRAEVRQIEKQIDEQNKGLEEVK